MAKRVLIVDDEQGNREALSKILEREGLQVECSASGGEALQLMREKPVDLVITDLKMPRMDGFELLKKIKLNSPLVEVIVVTAHGTIEKAVAAIKEGAYDFIAKPFDRISITKQVTKALEKQQLLQENQRLRIELENMRATSEVIGSSSAIKKVMESVEQAAISDATVLVLGESGTGKEVMARALYKLGRRNAKPFIKVHCTTLPENLLEAELFGYERGAFTGATSRKEGRFEFADGGTIFLDEIGDIPLSIQAKLLRVLQEGAFERLGSNVTKTVDVRIIAATNRNLRDAIQAGTFREDLFYRLNVIEIKVPPLRARKEDVPLLVDHFFNLFKVKNKKTHLRGISDETMNQLTAYDWPGNVRQLENTIERAVVFARGEQIEPGDLPELVEAEQSSDHAVAVSVGMPMSEIEKLVIRRTLEYTGGDKAKAAALLGIGVRTIYRKLSPDD